MGLKYPSLSVLFQNYTSPNLRPTPYSYRHQLDLSHLRPDLFRLAVQTLVSLILLVAGIIVLLTNDHRTNPEISLAAATWIGGVIGYWLK